ncbi:MAG: hypothetical protein EOM37_05055 [Proteobacteria bacterium]|nr:hypothetical protein [Pseudomonadota bacterium]
MVFSIKKIIVRPVVIVLLVAITLVVVAFLPARWFIDIPVKVAAKPDFSGPCYGRQWESPTDQLDCIFPFPPIGRWKAVYTESFAEKHNLPKENISTDLSSGVDYMEMDVQPYGVGGVACMVNMLVQKPNDIAVYNLGEESQWLRDFNKQRKVLHLLDLDEHKDNLSSISSLGNITPRDVTYNPHQGSTIGTTLAYHAEGLLEGYDYISADAGCRQIVMDKNQFPDGWAIVAAKASIWGRYKGLYLSLDTPNRPKGKEFFDSRILINIPHELITHVFEGMPIGGRRK